MMQNISKRDSNVALIVGGLGLSLLTMATFAVRQVFRVFRRRKVRAMNYRNNSVNPTAAAPARSLEPAEEPSDSTSFTNAPDTDSRFTMYASEAVLRRYWDTPEEDEAWDHL